jgi:hypothetical protein
MALRLMGKMPMLLQRLTASLQTGLTISSTISGDSCILPCVNRVKGLTYKTVESYNTTNGVMRDYLKDCPFKGR